jgi:hypothetical protein
MVQNTNRGIYNALKQKNKIKYFDIDLYIIFVTGSNVHIYI